MPRVTWNIPAKQRELEDELRKRYGGMMTVTDVSAELGAKHHQVADNFLKGLPVVNVNNRKRWRVSAVAERIYQNTGVTT